MGFLTGLVLVVAATLGGLYLMERAGRRLSGSGRLQRIGDTLEAFADVPPPLVALTLVVFCFAAVGVAFLLGL